MQRRRRHLIARYSLPVFMAGALLSAPVARAGAATAGSGCGVNAATALSATGAAYYLFESDGAVASCGGAPLHGSAKVTTKTPIVSGAATTAGGGYWLASSTGAVYAFGNAGNFGSTSHLRLRAPIVGFTPTPDNKGYWLVTAKGNLFHFGDAHFFGSTVHDQKDGTVVALLSTPDGQGYWIVSSTGVVHPYGDAPPVGSLAHKRPAVVAAVAGPDGRGLILLTKRGGIETLGTGAFAGSLVHHPLPRPPTSLAVSADGAGYLITNAAGSVFNFGDAAFVGSLAASQPHRPVAVVAISSVTLPIPAVLTGTVVAPTSVIPHGLFGYDISNFQCAQPGSSLASPSLPTSSPFSIIEAAGWLDGSMNSCLAAEAAWATAAAGSGGAHYSLYLFLNSPDQSSAAATLDASGPAGVCATLTASAQPACLAYNYGYQGAAHVSASAASAGVSAPLWWVDVEGSHLSPNQWSNFSAGQYWSSSTSLNADTIQGALDALRATGATVGVYSSSIQFPAIAGSYVPSGARVPLWVAGAPWTNPPYTQSGLASPSVLPSWCAGTVGYSTLYPTDLFAGGVPWILQETPGSQPSPYNIDPDYTC